jgi:hypothetical protein
LSRDTDVLFSPPTIGIVDPYDGNILEYAPAYVAERREYLIPHQNSIDWLRSNPVAHITFINGADSQDRGARELIRLVKAWKYASGSELSSLYLEMVTANYCLEHPRGHYLEELIGVLRVLKRLRLADIDDPSLKERRHLAPLSSDASSKELTLRIISTSLDQALRIDAAEKSGADRQVATYTSELFNFSNTGHIGRSNIMRICRDPTKNKFTGRKPRTKKKFTGSKLRSSHMRPE